MSSSEGCHGRIAGWSVAAAGGPGADALTDVRGGGAGAARSGAGRGAARTTAGGAGGGDTGANVGAGARRVPPTPTTGRVTSPPGTAELWPKLPTRRALTSTARSSTEATGLAGAATGLDETDDSSAWAPGAESRAPVRWSGSGVSVNSSVGAAAASADRAASARVASSKLRSNGRGALVMRPSEVE